MDSTNHSIRLYEGGRLGHSQRFQGSLEGAKVIALSVFNSARRNHEIGGRRGRPNIVRVFDDKDREVWSWNADA